MWEFGDAQAKVIQVVRDECSVARERLWVGQAAGRVLAESVVSPVAVPAQDYSAMDGYAVHTRDFSGMAPPTLPVRGECQTGHPSVSVTEGACVRIFTGAAIPAGADAVVMQENVEREGESAVFLKSPLVGENIRRAGEDLKQGDAVLHAGTRLSAFHLGLLASVERTEVLVARRPRATILCTGDELRPPGMMGPPGSLAESNSLALAALAQQVGAWAQRGPLVPDTLPSMMEALEEAAGRSELILTVGGVSVGDHDLVAPALAELGAEVYFHKVRIKPGKPVLFARLGGALVLGLPGNPSSAQVTFALFGVPLLRALQGDEMPVPLLRRARLLSDFRQKPGRLGFYRARLSADGVELYSNQASGATTSTAWADSLALVPADVSDAPAGTELEVLAYNDL
jgi:molybdopterin molybdotransferase